MKLPLVKPSERVILLGPTGSGKSELAKVILETNIVARGYSTIIVDPKHEWKWHIPSHTVNAYAQLLRTLQRSEHDEDLSPVIYRPPYNDAELDKVPYLALRRRHTFLAYDELAFIATASDYQKTAPNWARAMQQGRSLGVGMLNISQRPARIPLIAGSEADHRITFFLRNATDRKRAEEFMGEVPWDVLARNKYTFVWATDAQLHSNRRLKVMRLDLTPPSPPAVLTKEAV